MIYVVAERVTSITNRQPWLNVIAVIVLVGGMYRFVRAVLTEKVAVKKKHGDSCCKS
jgi:hypothetical protein